MKSVLVLAATSLAVSASWAAAQDASIGAAEYMNSCAQCHGVSGEGDGVIAGFLTKSPPDLTMLQKENGGVFPFSAVYNTVDGTTASGVHGTGDMPAWGARYSAKAGEQLGFDYTGADVEAFTRARILALVEFISTMQE